MFTTKRTALKNHHSDKVAPFLPLVVLFISHFGFAWIQLNWEYTVNIDILCVFEENSITLCQQAVNRCCIWNYPNGLLNIVSLYVFAFDIFWMNQQFLILKSGDVKFIEYSKYNENDAKKLQHFFNLRRFKDSENWFYICISLNVVTYLKY